MPFKTGDSVKVKKGVKCPDNEAFCLGGWQVRIFEMEKDGVIGIRWDSITLEQMPREFIRQSEEEGLGWTEMYLSPDEIEPASPRDAEKTADEVRKEMEGEMYWLGEGEEGERILKVISGAEDEVEAWDDYLMDTLQFPFDAEVSEFQEEGPLNDGDQVRVTGIEDLDDLYGILVNVNCGRKRFVFPLCDLTVLDKKSPNYLPVKDYCVWFANR
ncbi:MAG: hypothetical protein JW709_06625 [Sedimentisphaerales bacterium]|nr:hypothetical protein [Sedimentisphaerales bacterium]